MQNFSADADGLVDSSTLYLYKFSEHRRLLLALAMSKISGALLFMIS